MGFWGPACQTQRKPREVMVFGCTTEAGPLPATSMFGAWRMPACILDVGAAFQASSSQTLSS
eukprot:5416410-Amphidinium_carterae.1